MVSQSRLTHEWALYCKPVKACFDSKDFQAAMARSLASRSLSAVMGIDFTSFPHTELDWLRQEGLEGASLSPALYLQPTCATSPVLKEKEIESCMGRMVRDSGRDFKYVTCEVEV